MFCNFLTLKLGPKISDFHSSDLTISLIKQYNKFNLQVLCIQIYYGSFDKLLLK